MPSPVSEPSAEQRGKFRSIAAALDSLPLTKAQLWVMGLVMAGMFFDTLQQDAPGAIGTQLKQTLHLGTRTWSRSTRSR
jgi:putative MFS transporter